MYSCSPVDLRAMRTPAEPEGADVNIASRVGDALSVPHGRRPLQVLLQERVHR